LTADRPDRGPTGRLTRDGITRTGYLVLVTWGWFLYGFGALLPQLGRDQEISRTVTGLHSVMMASGALLAGALAVPMVRALRRRGVLRLGGLLVLTGSLTLVLGGAWTPVTLLAALIVGTGGALLVNTATSALSDHHQEHGAAALSEGNALAAASGLLAPLLVGAGVAAGLTWRPAVLVTVPLVLGMLLMLHRQPRESLALDQQLPPRQGRPARLPPAAWPAAGMVVACVGVEFCLTNWSAELLRERTGLAAGPAAAGVSAVIVGMTLGRVVTGRLALRHSSRRLLLAAIGLSLVGCAWTWLAAAPWAALLGLFVTGTGLAAHYPLGASVLFATAPGQRDQAVGVLSIGVGLAAGAGPFALGALADLSSTHTAFLVVPALLVVAAVLLLQSARMNRSIRAT
jgi:MFS family permease